jgi:trehalose-phosphatase
MRSWQELGSALDGPLIDARLGGRSPAVFLDYDGVLAEIAPHPADAVLRPERRRVLAGLAERLPVVIVSGRDLADVSALVALDGVLIAGSHGLDLRGPTGERAEHGADAFLPLLDAAERQLTQSLTAISGAWVERKRFSVAVHYRQVVAEDVDRVDAVVADVALAFPRLRRIGGKKVHELRPDVEWHKGRAVEWLLSALGLDRPDVVAVYLGDDETDEDAFTALAARGGWGILVGQPPHPTAATARLHDPDEVMRFLSLLSTRGDEPGGHGHDVALAQQQPMPDA